VPSPTDATLQTYEQYAERYIAASLPVVSAEWGVLLDALVARLLAGSRVLEIGTGPGLEAAYLEARGLVVDRTDATAAFVERLREQGHAARLLDVRSGDLGGPYDAVLANAVLLHLDRAEFAAALRACASATRTGGLLAVTLKEGDGESWSTAKLHAPRWFVYWREDALRDLLEQVGWSVLDLRTMQGRHEPWLHVLCSRADRTVDLTGPGGAG
jgi:SAM-dependent methyltransferase